MDTTESKSGPTRTSRELVCRESDGVHVLLLWYPDEDAVAISVGDSHVGRGFELLVDSQRALDAFYHPFAYAA